MSLSWRRVIWESDLWMWWAHRRGARKLGMAGSRRRGLGQRGRQLLSLQPSWSVWRPESTRLLLVAIWCIFFFFCLSFLLFLQVSQVKRQDGKLVLRIKHEFWFIPYRNGVYVESYREREKPDKKEEKIYLAKRSFRSIWDFLSLFDFFLVFLFSLQITWSLHIFFIQNFTKIPLNWPKSCAFFP